MGMLGTGSTAASKVPAPVAFDHYNTATQKIEKDVPIEIQQLGANWTHSMALSASGKVYSWGRGEYGQLALAHNSVAQTSSPTLVKALERAKIKHIACGRAHNLFLTDNDVVLANGANELGQLGLNKVDQQPSVMPQTVEGLRHKDIGTLAVGLDHSFALSRTGLVWSWGWGQDGQLGHGVMQDEVAPKKVINLAQLKIKQVSPGHDHTLVLDEQGGVWAFGYNEVGQCGTGKAGQRLTKPTRIQLGLTDPRTEGSTEIDNKAVDIACGGAHSLVLESTGDVWSFGTGKAGRLGHGTEDPCLLPKRIEFFAEENLKIVKIACGGGHNFALAESGELFTWGFGATGRLGHGNDDNQLRPTVVKAFQGHKVLPIFIGGLDHSLVVTEEPIK